MAYEKLRHPAAMKTTLAQDSPAPYPDTIWMI
jgi:hypothetical protein